MALLLFCAWVGGLEGEAVVNDSPVVVCHSRWNSRYLFRLYIMLISQLLVRQDTASGMQSRGKALPAGKEVLLPLPKNRQVSACRFFYPSRRLGITSLREVRCISSRAAKPPLYLITRQRAFPCVLMIYRLASDYMPSLREPPKLGKLASGNPYCGLDKQKGLDRSRVQKNIREFRLERIYPVATP